jgi:hypothetical protein
MTRSLIGICVLYRRDPDGGVIRPTDLIDVVTDPNAVSLPPQVDYKQVKGMALATHQFQSPAHVKDLDPYRITGNPSVIR